jgi:predicted nucleic acid-binding protein
VIVVDTNALSELLRPAPDPRVLQWFERQPRAALFTTTVTRGEILYGVRLLPEGQRRRSLYEAVLAIFGEDFSGRVLAFDVESADLYAEIAASRKAAGRPLAQFDAMIAAVARSRGAALATRNLKDFDDCGVELMNPWGS